jgi:hypothetical protein
VAELNEVQTKRSAQLQQVVARGLTFCPNLTEIAGRWESWWRFEARRPLLRFAMGNSMLIRWDSGFDLLENPAEWVKLRRKQVENTILFGEELPSARVNLGPVAQAAFLGAPLHFAEQEGTSWQDPIIEDWEQRPSLAFDPANPWYGRTLALMRALAEDAAGHYLVCFPDMSGAMDILANLRGSQRLCFDLLDHREQVKKAAMDLMPAWCQVFDAFQDAVLENGAGTTQWLGCWSNIPYVVATCDFNALVGPDDFADLCLPALHAQGAHVGRCLFHLDGPAAARHADAIAADDAISAIQYVPGAGTPSAVAKLDMLRRVQKAGKPLIIPCPSSEIEELCDKLDPRGLAFMPYDVQNAAHAEQLLKIVSR